MKRFLAALLALVCCAPSVSAESGYCSMKEIREETPERWTETYQTQWRTVEIDVPIEVPQIDKLPILKIDTGSSAVAQDRRTAYEYVCYNDSRGFDGFTSKALSMEYDLTPAQSRKLAGRFERGERPNVQPEGVTLGYEDALALCYEEIQRLWGLSASQAGLLEVTAYDGVYTLKRKNGEKIWGKRVDGRTGFWGFTFDQLFHGISMESCDNGNAYDDYFFIGTAARPIINFSIWSNDRYQASASVYGETAVVYEDVPLRSFADAKAAIEGEIIAGHLRYISKVKLCYIPYLDPAEKEALWLLPAWYVEGIYTGNAQKDLEPVYADDGSLAGYEGGVNDGMVVAYEANRGQLIDRKDTSSKRRNVPEIITWDKAE